MGEHAHLHNGVNGTAEDGRAKRPAPATRPDRSWWAFTPDRDPDPLDPSGLEPWRVELRKALAVVPASGLFPEFLKYCLPVTDAPPSFLVGAALVLASHQLGRRVWLEHGAGRLYANLWVGLLGQGAHLRKSTVLNLVEGLVRQPDNPCRETLLSQTLSLGQWTAALGHGPTAGPKRGQGRATGKGLCLVHELGDWLSLLSSGGERKARRTLTEWYDVPERWTRTNRAGIVELRRPCVNLLAAAAPAWLARQARVPGGPDAFCTRWLWFAGAGKDFVLPLPKPPDREQQRAVLKALARLHRWQGPMRLTPEAQEYYTGWLELVGNERVVGLLPRTEAWKARLGATALKVAMIFEASRSGRRFITVHSLCLAMALLDRQRGYLEEALVGEEHPA
jgi:hypothetical protein